MSEMNCEVRDGGRQVRTPVPLPERTTERTTQHLAGLTAGPVPRPVGRVGIIGADTAGIGIAMRLLDADIPVTILDRERSALDKALAAARSRCQDAVTNGELAADARDRRMALLAGTVYFHHLKDCDLIIDTEVAGLDVKESLFRRLDEAAKPGAILMTADARCDVDHLARFTRRSGEVLGLRILHPANERATWEFVPAKGTSEATLATVMSLSGKLRKLTTVSRMRDGSVPIRIGIAGQFQ
jgi:3-hydroxyacyl-CoA dehydrogenase